MTWVIRRKAAFEYLLEDDTFDSNSKEMRIQELTMLKSIATPDSTTGKKFWAIAFTVKVLSDWGMETSVWFHSCQCPKAIHPTDKSKKQCKLKGRRAISLACGSWKTFIRNLENLTLSNDALTALAQLDQGEQSEANFIHRCFQDRRDKMVLKHARPGHSGVLYHSAFWNWGGIGWMKVLMRVPADAELWS